MTKKWEDPLDRLIKADNKAQSINSYLKEITESDAISSEVLSLDPCEIIRWKYKDRPESEFGNIKELAETFKNIGQQQPCIVRVAKGQTKHKYELIVGERRLEAAKLAQIKIKVIVENMDDKTASLIQAVENEKRIDLSDYARGISFSEKISKGFVTQNDLVSILGISKQQVTRLLSFSKIPAELLEAIGDFKLVSARTAYEISRLAKKGDNYVKALATLAKQISAGKIGSTGIIAAVERKSKPITQKSKLKNKKVSVQGTHIYSLCTDDKGTPSIRFSKHVVSLIQDKIINIDSLSEELTKCIVKHLPKPE